MHRRMISLVVLLACGLAGCGPSEDYSTPKSAAKTFYSALMGGEMATVKAALADDQQRAVVDDLRSLIEGIVSAKDAAVAKFGQPGDSVSGGLPSMEDVEKATESITGERAVLRSPAPGTIPVRLRKVGGQWKVDLFATLSMDGQNCDAARRVMQSATRGVGEVAEKIRGGQFKSAAEAEDALKQTLAMSAVAEMLKGLRGGG